MKFIKLTIHNLASIEDAVIDFEHGPLADDSRFLICGPTGAGKTTILDAICLALYGTTPRLTNQKAEAYVDQYENFKLKDRTDVKINDTRMLMRRGSLSAFVELIFTDKDDKLLKALWQCNRSHNKIQGVIKEPDWLLFDGVTDALLSDKKSICLKLITSRIGLSFEQFCRTTMLAQGDFTKFLKSDEGEKSQILEKLTGTDIYSDISIRIHQLKVEKENLRMQISSKLEGVQLLSEDEIETINQNISELKKKINNLNQEEESLIHKYQWKSSLCDLVKQKDEVDKSLKIQLDSENSAQFKDEESLLEDWQNTHIQRELWKTRKTAKHEISDRQEEIRKLQKEYSYLTSGLLGLNKKLDEKLHIKEKIQNYLAQEAIHESCYRQISFIELLSNQHQEAVTQIKDSSLKIQQQEKRLDSFGKELASANNDVNKYDSISRQNSNKINTLNSLLSTLNYDALLKERDTTDKKLSELKDYRQLVQQYVQVSKEKATKLKDYTEVKDSIVVLTQEVQVTEKSAEEMEKRLREQTEIYEKQERACSDVMNEYRSLLHVGDTCPLCGNKILQLENNEHFVSILKPVKELLNHIQLSVNEVTKQLSDKKAQLKVTQTELIKKQKDLDLAIQNESQITEQLTKNVLYTTYGSNDSVIIKIDSAIEVINDSLKTISSKLQEIGKLQGNINLIQKEKEQVEKQLRLSEKKAQEIVKQQIAANEFCQNERTLIEKLTLTSKEKLDELAKYIDLNEYTERGIQYIDNLKVGAQRYQIANDKLLSVDNHINEITSELKVIRQIKDTIDAQHPSWSEVENSSSLLIEQLSDAWLKLQTKVSRLIEALHLSEQQYAKADDELHLYFENQEAVSEERLKLLSDKPVNEVESLFKEHQKARDLRVKLTTNLDTAQKNLANHLKNKPDLQDDVTLETLGVLLQTKKDEVKEQHQLLGKLTQSLDIDKKNRTNYAIIEKDLKKATLESDRWNHLHQLFGSNDGKKFRNIAQSYVLEQLLVNANQYLRQFTTRYEMECQPGCLTILLRDKDAGGVLRPTTTISGGESFLISLSLALGLSSLSRTSLSMDTLFIDEGFGTLDSTYLSSVMDALERLHQLGGKRIGIISHVESLKERITTQIQVSRVNNTLSKINVVSLV